MQVVSDSYQQTVLSSLEGWLWRGVVSLRATSGLTSQEDNAATMNIVYGAGTRVLTALRY